MASRKKTPQRQPASSLKRRGDPAYSLPQGDIFCGDALEFLNSLREKSADIIFLDPPFNLGKRYGRNGAKADLVQQDAYFKYLSSVLVRSASVLKDGGALYLYHIPRWAFKFANVLEQYLTFRHWIAISMKNGFVRGTSLYPAHYSLLYFTKGEPSHFQRPKLKPPRCRHCDEYTKDYGGYKDFVKDGINLSDVWEDLSPVRHKKFKHRKPNELPLEIPRRAVKVSGVPKGVLVDPFAGSGTSLVAALEGKMRFIACDSQQSYCKLMSDRLLRAANPKPASTHLKSKLK
jgi:site-specific DNA-methyltransferase (adenine-specific)